MRGRLLCLWISAAMVFATAPAALRADTALDEDTYCQGVTGTDYECNQTLQDWCEDRAPHSDCCYKEGSRLCFIYVNCSFTKLADLPGNPPPSSCGAAQ